MIPRRNKEDLDAYKSYVKSSAVGLEVGLSIIVGLVAGYFLDRELGWEPWGMVGGLVIGCIAAGRALYSFSRKFLRENPDDD